MTNAAVGFRALSAAKIVSGDEIGGGRGAIGRKMPAGRPV
jgi:hypothetical protein